MGRPLTGGVDAGVALRVDRLSKTYPGTQALRDVSLTVAAGSVHTLAGGNGSGKSTLLRILAGVTAADPGGRVTVHGAETTADQVTPHWAHRVGLRFVHQELGLFPDLSVMENLGAANGFPTVWPSRIDWRSMHRHAESILQRFGVDATPDTVVRALDLPSRSLLAIARAFSDDSSTPCVFVLDEATAALSAPQTELVWRLIDEQVAHGHAVLVVAHQLDEVMRADTATVLRDGEVVATVEPARVDRSELVELIVGRPVGAPPPPRPQPAGPERLSVDDLGGRTARGVTFSLRRGEILGLAGPPEAGQQEVLEMLFGAARARSGAVALDGARRSGRRTSVTRCGAGSRTCPVTAPTPRSPV